MAQRFNVRVYGLWIENGSVLVNEEIIRGKKITKFPGGGMELGEGTHDCLKREWMEEMGLVPQIVSHFYTTDFFQQSAYDDSQILSIYYRVMADAAQPIANLNENETTFWLEVNKITPDTFTLPIDKIVGNMVKMMSNEFQQRR